MKQLILSAEAVNPDPKPLDDLIAVLKGIMKSYGYNDTVGLQVNNGWHPVSEKPTDEKSSDRWYLFWIPKFQMCELSYWHDLIDHPESGVTHWQPLPEPPDDEEVEK